MADATKAAQSVWMFEPAYRDHVQAQIALTAAQERAKYAEAIWLAAKAERERQGLMPESGQGEEASE